MNRIIACLLLTTTGIVLAQPDPHLPPYPRIVNTIGYTQTLDLRQNPLVDPRGFVANNTLDVATQALGSDIQLIRSTARVAYFLPFGPKTLTPGVAADQPLSPWRRWLEQSSLAFGARAGIVHS